MRLEHPPRFTGSTSKTGTNRVWNVSMQLRIYNQATTTAHFIYSSSISYIICGVRRNYTRAGYNHFAILPARSIVFFYTYDECYYRKRHMQVRSTTFNAIQISYANEYILQRVYQCDKNTLHIQSSVSARTTVELYKPAEQDCEQLVQYELFNGEWYCRVSLAQKCTESFIPIDVLGNTAFNRSNYDKTPEIIPFRSMRRGTEATLCFDLPGNTIVRNDFSENRTVLTNPRQLSQWAESGNWREKRHPKHRTNRTHNSAIITNKLNDLSLAKDDVWMEETISKRPTSYFCKYEKNRINEFLHRKFNGRSYGLLLFFYLLAWPLLCSTYPSTGIIASVSFIQKSSLVRDDNVTVHNLSPIARSRSSSSHITLQSHKEHPQNREQVHPYNEYTWEVNQINPWLSACDLAGPAPADLQGSCGPPEVPKYCPIPCSSSVSADRIFHEVVERLVVPRKWRTGSAAKIRWRTIEKTVEGSTAPDQCLFYLDESHKRDICRKDFAQSSSLSFSTSRENRYWFLSGLRLRHCCEHAVINALTPGEGGPLDDVLNGSPRCIIALEKILSVDALAARLHCEFEEVLARYDCRQSYSVIHNCTHCKEAYRKWVCSSLVPYFAHEGPSTSLNSVEAYVGTRLRPCRSFCQSVEQRCPYLLPGDRAPAYPTQYAGEPTFLCRDPNIPETGGQAVRALHGDEEEECCFRVCSEDEPGSGVCTSCAENELHRLRVGRDPPSAPHCEIMGSVQSDAADPQNNAGTGLGLSLLAPQSTTSASSSFCVNGETDSISSLSSSSNTTLPPVPVSLLCFLWAWVALMSLCQKAFPWSPALDAGFVCESSSWLTKSKISNVDELRVMKRKSSSTIFTVLTRTAQQLPYGIFHNLKWFTYRCILGVYSQTLKYYCVRKRMSLKEQNVFHCDADRRCFSYDPWHCCRHSLSARKRARIRGGRLKRRRRRRFGFSS